MVVEDFPTVFKIGVEEFDITRIYHQYWNLVELSGNFERDKELCIVAELDERIVGFALGHKRFSIWRSDLGYLEWLAVSKEYQRKGIGSALCEEMLRRFERMGIKRILADARAEGNAPRRLLEKFSFKKLFSVNWFIKEIQDQ